MLTYRRADTLKVVGFSDFDYAGYVDNKSPLLVISLCWLKELFRGKVSSRHLQLFLLLRQSM